MTYTFKLARRLAVSRPFRMTAVALFVFAPTDLLGQPSFLPGDEIVPGMPSGVLLGITLAAGVLGAVGLAAFLDWLRKLPSQLPFQIAIWMVLSSGVFAGQAIRSPELPAKASGAGEVSGNIQDIQSKPMIRVKDSQGRKLVSPRDLANATLSGLCLLPPAWFIVKRKNSPSGLIRLALIFSLGFLLYMGATIALFKRLL
jgi:hypothetical protein